MKPTVFIIQKLTNGVKNNFILIIGFLFFVLASCKSVNDYSKYNYFDGSVYYNDNLNISCRFFGDIKFTKKNGVKFQTINQFKKGNLLLYGKATTSPTYEVFLYFNKIKNYIKKDSTYLTLNDKVNQIVIYTKEKDDSVITLCLKSIEKHKSNLSMLNDGKNIINTFKFDVSVKDELDYFQIFNTYKDESNFLYAINKFDTAPIEENESNKWTKLQLLLTFLSNDTGYYRYNNLIENFESKRKEYLNKLLDSISLNEDYLSGQSLVIDKIQDISKDQTVVMLNENHWYPKHRVFASKLLKPLRDNGFKYLAIEAVEKDSALNKRTFPTKNTGFYSREPFFGTFIREAIKTGYIIVGYDDFTTSNREEAQANNIKKIFENDPDAKIFVYAGIDHILEKNEQKKRMAEYFTELTDINPLTIDQVELVSDSVQKVALYNAQLFNKIERVNNNVDYFLINNLDASLNEVYGSGFLKKIILEDYELSSYSNQEVLISLYYFNEYEKYKSNCVPVLNKIKTINQGQLELNIPKGVFRIKIMSKNNELIISKKITI